jgi:hypothetical protein
MFREEQTKTKRKVTIQILGKNKQQFAKFKQELLALLKKHGVKRRR